MRLQSKLRPCCVVVIFGGGILQPFLTQKSHRLVASYSWSVRKLKNIQALQLRYYQ